MKNPKSVKTFRLGRMPIMPLLIRRWLCAHRGHPLGRWDYLAERQCDQLRTCNCGGQKETEVVHSFYKSYNKRCIPQLVCNRCGSEATLEATPVHCWTESWKYVSEDSCEEGRYCERCHMEETRTAPHRWSNWNYEVDCVELRTCSRCGRID